MHLSISHMKTSSYHALFCLVCVLLLSGCGSGSTESDTEVPGEDIAKEEEMKKDDMPSNIPSPQAENAPETQTTCAAQSCGEGGSAVSCLTANGCICTDQGCADCRRKNETCSVSRDCCGGQGLACQSVRLSSGTTEKRCTVQLGNICSISCSEDGTWEKPRSCVNGTVHEDIEDCDTYEGSCTPPIPGERPRKCLRT